MAENCPVSSDHCGRDHWLCPGCGTFDGPISYRRCDACDDRPEVRAMGYLDEADRLRAENEALKALDRDVRLPAIDDLRDENERYRATIRIALDTMAVANDEQLGPGGVARKAYAGLWHAYFAIPAGIETPAASDETLAPTSCGRLLVGQGDDTYDPECVLPTGHEGRCKPEIEEAT